ncbi:MAG: DUF1549 and DUF1553 domain-containing protein [Planctomycetota bacterium]
MKSTAILVLAISILAPTLSGQVAAEHWSLRPLSRPSVPSAATGTARSNAIDRFLERELRANGRSFAPRAETEQLVRRLSLDLLGLPPSDAVRARLGELQADAALDALVEEYLASDAHAERMAVWWLDLVRYADTVGYHGDQEHHVSPYRDWVLAAFRDNLSFDRFTRDQLAGDLVADATDRERTASAYNRILQTTHEGGAQPGEYLAKYAADRVRNFGMTWMGVTLGCAECHDHKYDPYSQRDFYRVAAFFADIDEEQGFAAPNTSPTKRPPEIDVSSPIAGGAPTRRVMVTKSVAPRVTRVLRRGDWMDAGGEVVAPGVPSILPQPPVSDRRLTRLDLAAWVTSPQQPQTARVLVNRIWALFFGRGISPSLDDSGVRAAPPSHPELLDWLACELVDSGWDLRHVIRTIVRSRAYRQASAASLDATADRLLAAQRRWRLPAEFVRDQVLSTSGLLVERFGGDSARPYQPAGYYAHLNFPKREYRVDTDDGLWRRGIYMHWQRMFLHPMLKAFDAPTREECTAERSISNTPLQALVLLNDPSFVEASRVFATKVLATIDGDDRARVTWLWRRTLVREPTAAEVTILLDLLARARARHAADPSSCAALLGVGTFPLDGSEPPHELAAWTAVCRVILNLHETVTRS